MKKILLSMGVLILAGAGLYLFIVAVPHPSRGSSVFASPTEPLVAAEEAGTAALGPHREAPEGYKEYYNPTYRFSLFYPKDLSVTTYDEGKGAATIVFQNPGTATGFQIFITPYGASQVSEDQFKKDAPSGVRKNTQAVTIDGALAASFYGSSIELGETAEVWVIHGGYMYEITAPKTLASWLSGIMANWKFI